MRLFVAIELSKKVQSALARVQASLGKTFSDVRWTQPDRMHLTVKFLGDVADSDVDSTARAVRDVAANGSRFELVVEGTGCFPPQGFVKIVWAGVREETGSLLETAKQLDEALLPLGFPQELRPFSPHLTLARIRRDESDGALRTAVDACTFAPVRQAVSKLTVMSSVLSRNGPTYTPICTAQLGRT